MSVASLKLDQLKIEGVSVAGEETWFRIHPPGLAFDAGRGAPQLMGAQDVFLTHGHLDHSLGVPYVLSQRRVQGLGATRIFCPEAIRDRLESFLRSAEQLEEAEYEWSLQGLRAGDKVPVGKDLVVEAFESDHVIPSLGYHLLRRRSRLKEAYRGMDSKQLVELKRRGTVIEKDSESLWLSYCGDTGPGVFDFEPRLFEAEVLLVECTFFEEGSRGRSAEFKHMHIEDLAERAARFHNSTIVLHHASRRYSRQALEAEVEARLSGVEAQLHLL